ncbi:hypothetical protein O0235_11495 [Tepidiforma flava]|uniref:Uncharacterized protein n=1 Tax=Tepidiforma flava TaxID=3004094 RepID=A0ABY7M6I4_9CHLR|nr:hypothetical protein [Tepidiforma flava]WBL35396.1 hypothetical protein O0235_11495 [Tepidiforma flava]
MTARQRDRHVHRWRIDEPNGTPWLEGRCAACGACRRFPASHEAWVGQAAGRGISRDRLYPAIYHTDLPSYLRVREWREWA